MHPAKVSLFGKGGVTEQVYVSEPVPLDADKIYT